ncbi:hypothetical protein Q1695_003329 [Nippostrongylus brasiliensis]|nr:hypothetical protein Q1695_003329 [Nippostrongylus brasiliensis]
MPVKERRRTLSPVLVEFVEEDDEGDLLLAENESLRMRVAELEKTVNRQQSELMLLQTTSADLLRRVAKMEMMQCNGNVLTISTKPPQKSRMPSRNISQSSYNISKAVSPCRNGLSKSLYAPASTTRDGSAEECPRVYQPSPAASRRQTAGMVNVSMGKSLRGSPLRKWMSHQNVKGSQAAVGPQSVESSLSGRTTPSLSSMSQTLSSWAISRSVSRAASICTLHSSPRGQHNYGCNAREPIFNASSHVLQLQIAGRSVTVPVPSSVERLNTTAEQPPPEQLSPRIEWAYGYRGKDVRNNVHCLPTGELLYFCGSVVVLHNVNEQTQRHYSAHTSDVKCICLHPNRVFVATGQTTCHQRERRPEFDRSEPVASAAELEQDFENQHTEAHVRIWDSVTLATLHILGGSKAMFEKSIATIAFSITDGGNLLACVDESYQHTLSVWKWADETKVAEAKGANDHTFVTSWHPTIKNLIVVCGRGHFSFWILDTKTETLSKNSAVFEDAAHPHCLKGRDKPRTVLSLCFSESGEVITGDSNGTLSLWDPTTFKTKKQAHAVHPGGVFALCISRKGTLLSAGKDRCIAEWETSDLVRLRRPIELPDDAGTPRVILNSTGNKIIVGTSRNALFVGDFDTEFEEFVDGDSEDITCCVTVQSHLFITASADGGVRQYNSSTKKREWRKNYGEGITCASVDSQGTIMALGFCSGSWSAVNLSTRETVFEQKESTQPITTVQFAPNGSLLFVATKDLSALIYRHDGSHRFQRSARIGALSSFVISTDWDISSQFIRGNSSVGHIYHWSATNGELVDQASVRDVNWATCNCRLSYEAGCVAHSVEGITFISRSLSKDILAVGRDNGSLRLYSCPTLSTTAGFLSLSGHSHALSTAVFTGDHLISAGITDNSLFQWKLR